MRPDKAAPARDEIARDLAELDALVEEILLASRIDHIEKLERVEPVDLLAYRTRRRRGGPRVSAHVETERGSVMLKVRDHGPGLPEATGEHVFEPFFRLQGRSETAGGWRFGLSQVRQIALHHGATVRHESPSGGGACFVVTFPSTS